MFKTKLTGPGLANPVDIQIERTAAEQMHMAQIGDRPIEFELGTSSATGGWLRIQERVYRFHVVRDGRKVQVWLDGRLTTFEPVVQTPRRATAGDTTARSNVLTAPMPGTVLKVVVAAGDAFEPHQPLVVMESMKMEMTLSVPHAGRVREVLCKPGQLAALGEVLVKLDDADAQAAPA